MATNYLKHFVYCNQVKYDYNIFNGDKLHTWGRDEDYYEIVSNRLNLGKMTPKQLAAYIHSI